MLRPFVAAEVSGDWETTIAELKAPLSIQSAGAHDGTQDQALWDHRSEPCVFPVFSSGGIPFSVCVPPAPLLVFLQCGAGNLLSLPSAGHPPHAVICLGRGWVRACLWWLRPHRDGHSGIADERDCHLKTDHAPQSSHCQELHPGGDSVPGERVPVLDSSSRI